MSDERRRRGNVLVTPAVQMTAAASGSSGISVADSAEYDLAASDFALPVKFAYQEGGENLLTYSEQFDNAAWVASAGVTVTPNTHTAPDGTLSADTIGGSGNELTQSLTVSNATVYDGSIYVRKTTGATVFPMFAHNFFSTGGQIILNTNTGLLVIRDAALSTGVTADDAGGYWRVDYSGTSNTTAGSVKIYPAASTTGNTYTGGTGSIVVWGAQLETGSVANTYTKTEATANLNWLYYKYQDASNYWGLRLRSDKIMQFLAVTAGVTRLSITSTAALTATQGQIIEGVFTCTRESASAAGSGSFYVNGSQLGTSVAIAAATPPSIRNTGILYIMGSNAVRNLSQAVRAILTNFAPTAAQVSTLYSSGIPDAWMWGDSSNVYGNLTGVSGTYFSTPDSVANSITGDIDVRCEVAMSDWTPAANTTLLGKAKDTNNRAYRMAVDASTGRLYFGVSPDGTGAEERGFTSSASPSVVDGAKIWVRAACDVDDGAGGSVCTFYTSADGVSWTQLGLAITSTATSIVNNDSAVEIASLFSGEIGNLSGKIYRAQVYNGIGGTLAVDFNPSDYKFASTFASKQTGETWTINGAATIVGVGATLALLPETLPISPALEWPDSANGNDATLPAAGATKVTIRA